MKTIKCFMGVLLGIVASLWSACTPRRQPKPQPPPIAPARLQEAPPAPTQPAGTAAPATQPGPAAPKSPETQKAPPPEKNLPVRLPILE